MAIDATVGGAAADSYVTLEEADAYMGSRFGTAAWDGLATADREKAIRQATREVDRHRFHGYRNSTAQALEFPRAYPYNADEPITTTVASIPRSVRHACCEQALWIARHAATGGVSQRQSLQAQGVKSFQVGDLREDFGEGRSLRPDLCPEAGQLLAGWINRTARMYVPGREEPADWSTPL